MSDPRFMLDTDTVSYALRGQGEVGARILEHRPSELCLSAITVAELRYGTARRKSSRLDQLVESFIGNIAVASFDETCATNFGRIASALVEKGTPIGELDAMIAAHAMALGVTLVTNNLKHFSRVPGLKLANWF